MNTPFATDTWDELDPHNTYGIRPDLEPYRRRAEKEPVRLGIIGGGGVAQAKHLPAIHRLQSLGENVEVVAIADPADAGRVAADRYSAAWYRSYEEMLDEERLDAVEHLTGPAAAGPILRDLVRRRIPVLREKPLLFGGYETLSEAIKEAREICELAARTDTVVATGFCKRFCPPYAKAKELVEDGTVTDPAMITGRMVQAWAGSSLFEQQSIHLIDVMRYVMGDVETVYTTGTNKYGKESYDVDNAIIDLEFESGSVGTLYQNSTSPSMKPWERVEIFGDGAWVQIENSEELLLYDSEEGPTKSWRPSIPNTLVFDEEFGGYVGEIENFLDAVRGLDEPRADCWDGYEALRIADAAHRSFRDGEKKTVAD